MVFSYVLLEPLGQQEHSIEFDWLVKEPGAHSWHGPNVNKKEELSYGISNSFKGFLTWLTPNCFNKERRDLLAL